MDNSSRIRDDSRQRRRHTKTISESSVSDDSNSDEKKESDCGSSSSIYAEHSSWQETQLVEEGSVAASKASTPLVETPAYADPGFASNSPIPPSGFSSEEAAEKTTGHQGVDHAEIEDSRIIASIGSGLHHRHNFGTSTMPGNNNAGANHLPINSPTRRRRARPVFSKVEVEHQHRKRKWTVVQIFRSLLLSGAGIYFMVMLRGTQILMRQGDSNDENPEPARGRFSDYLPEGYVSHPSIQGYLRTGSVSIESLTPFVHKSTQDSPEVVYRAVEQRRQDRWKRTRPPGIIPSETSIVSYGILSEYRASQTKLQPESFSSPANAAHLCGEHARNAREKNPDAFLEEDALMNKRAKVLITGIVSNPLAFHLALTLKERCGVEVLVGIDPLIPNTIQNRMQHVEQMQTLASNTPKMVQPILVPLLGLDPRVKKSKKDASSELGMMLELTDELNIASFEPTHIVHLSTASYQNPVSTNIPQSPMAPKRPLSPYQIVAGDSYEPSLFHIRSSMMAMEQILTSLVHSAEDNGNTPHFTFAAPSSIAFPATFAGRDELVLSYSKQADEVLASTYYALFGVNSVGIRFPPNAIYGPWDTQTKLHSLLSAAMNGNFTAFGKQSHAQEFIFVQDAVEAIISAMQYRESSATTFDMVGSPPIPWSKVASLAESAIAGKVSSAVSLVEIKPQSNSQSQRTLEKLNWKSKTPVNEGVLRTLAWHLDRAKAYGVTTRGQAIQPSVGSPPEGTGDALLLANSVSPCAADDLVCRAGAHTLPCASECSVNAHCKPSIFDSVQQLSREMTEGCDAVLYTQSLSLKLEDLKLQSQFEDDVEPVICNLAFVAHSSPLVKAVIEKIPSEELRRLGVPATSPFSEKLQKLNGRLLYRGWILIWVNPVNPVSLADSSLLKLSPGRMFSSDVLYAVFVEENFTVSPTTDDVRFLISQMDRGATKQRNIYRMVKKDEDSKPVKMKFTLAAQPARRSTILVSQLKFKISERGRIPQDTKISVMDAVRFMRFEIGSDPTKERESAAIKRQKDFYRRIPSFINGKDLRDNFEPIYKYELKHWVRTRWVVHDLTLEESRELRCDWYQEHVQWGAEIDQLSFAAVMARRIIDRRMRLAEPDDRTKPKEPELNELKDVADHDEWFAMATENNKENGDIPGVEEVAAAEAKDDEDEAGGEEGPDTDPSEPGYSAENRPGVGLYVRIISDRIMSLSRKAWARYRAEIEQAVAAH